MNLEQLKATIEAEALRRQAARDGFTLDAVKEYLGAGAAMPAMVAPPPPPPEPLTFAYFAALHGAALVQVSYRTLLGREPDPPGLEHHVGMLARGEDKALVVGSVRYSPEGRARAVPVLGLFPRFAAAAAQRVPVAGAFLGMLVALLTANARMRHARALEEYLRGQLDAVGAHIDRSSGVVAMRIEALRGVLEHRE
jgi:hypothetical protein